MAGSGDTISVNKTTFNVGETLSVTISPYSLYVSGKLYIGDTEISIQNSEKGDYTYDYTLTNSGTFNVHFINYSYSRDSNIIQIVVNPTEKVSLKVRLDNIFEYLSNKITSWNGSETNTQYPSAKLVKDTLDTKVNINDIVDNLTSTSSTKPLSAKQGKVLNDMIGDAILYIVGSGS